MVVSPIVIVLIFTYMIGLIISPIIYWHYKDYNKEQRLKGNRDKGLSKKWHVLAMFLGSPLLVPLMGILMLADLALYLWGFIKSLNKEIV